jgi:hypothetical protein
MVDLMDGESFVCGDKRKAGSSPVREDVEDRSRSSATKGDVKRRAIGISGMYLSSSPFDFSFNQVWMIQ